MTRTGAPTCFRVGVELVHELGRADVERALQVGPFVHEPLEHRSGSGEGERVTDERPGEERHTDLGERFVPVAPLAAIERVHVLSATRHEADRKTAADDLAIRCEVGPDPEQRLGAALVGAETRDHLVEDEGRRPSAR